jgi:hypothetical protein
MVQIAYVHASCSGAGSIHTWEVMVQGTYIFKKKCFLRRDFSDSLAKMESKMD